MMIYILAIWSLVLMCPNSSSVAKSLLIQDPAPDLGPETHLPERRQPPPLLLLGPELGLGTLDLGTGPPPLHPLPQRHLLCQDSVDLGQGHFPLTAAALTALAQLEIKIYLTVTALEAGLVQLTLPPLEIVCSAVPRLLIIVIMTIMTMLILTYSPRLKRFLIILQSHIRFQLPPKFLL